MKKKLKAFTLIELIVSLAVFGILMAGIVKMIEPLSVTATNAAVLNNQRNVENAIVTYIGENLRYANNLAIIEGGTVDDAITRFISLKPTNTDGYEIDYTVTANKNKIRVIAFDGKNKYKFNNWEFYGRVISTTEGRSGSLDFSNLKSDGSSSQYLVFGNDYYAQGDYNLDACICDGSLRLSMYSDYYYTSNKNGKFNSTSNTPTRGSYELRTMVRRKIDITTGKAKDEYNTKNVFACLKSTQSDNTNNVARVGNTNREIIYFVYTLPGDEVTSNENTATNKNLAKCTLP